LTPTFLIYQKSGSDNQQLRTVGHLGHTHLGDLLLRTTCVRDNGVQHDFMMLNPLRGTAAATGAIERAVRVLRKALRSG